MKPAKQVLIRTKRKYMYIIQIHRCGYTHDKGGSDRSIEDLKDVAESMDDS